MMQAENIIKTWTGQQVVGFVPVNKARAWAFSDIDANIPSVYLLFEPDDADLQVRLYNRAYLLIGYMTRREAAEWRDQNLRHSFQTMQYEMERLQGRGTWFERNEHEA